MHGHFADDPRGRFDIKVLKGKMGDIKRLRLGKYRILFDDENEVMSVYEVKQEAYNDTMIKTQIVKENNKPVAVIMDYKEYVRLREIEQERKDYYFAARTRDANKKWTDHEELKKDLGL